MKHCPSHIVGGRTTALMHASEPAFALTRCAAALGWMQERVFDNSAISNTSALCGLSLGAAACLSHPLDHFPFGESNNFTVGAQQRICSVSASPHRSTESTSTNPTRFSPQRGVAPSSRPTLPPHDWKERGRKPEGSNTTQPPPALLLQCALYGPQHGTAHSVHLHSAFTLRTRTTLQP